MENSERTPPSWRGLTFTKKIWAVIAGIGTVAGAIGIVSQFSDFRAFVTRQWAAYGTVDLPGSLPGETWKPATVKDFEWLQDEWCYPSQPDFKSRFRVSNGVLSRQNVGSKPDPFVTDWVNAEVFVSNRGLVRLRYVNSEWPGTYIDRPPTRIAEWRESERYTADDGTVSAGPKRLVLSCRRCRLSSDGMTYSCNK